MSAPCHICQQPTTYKHEVGGYSLRHCTGCNLQVLDPQPSDQQLSQIYGQNYYLSTDPAQEDKVIEEMKHSSAITYLSVLQKYVKGNQPNLLEIGCGNGHFLAAAKAAGFSVGGIEVNPAAVLKANRRLGEQAVMEGELTDLKVSHMGKFDFCVLTDVIEHVRSPFGLLESIWYLLNPGGICFIVTPSLTSWSARLLRRHWMEYKPEHLYYFSPSNIRLILQQCGFSEVDVTPNWKTLNFGYINLHMQKFKVPILSSVSQLLSAILPAKLSEMNFRVVASGMNVTAHKISD